MWSGHAGRVGLLTGRAEGEKEVSWARVVGPAGLLVGPSGERGKRGAGWAGLTGLETGFGSSFLFLSSFSNKLKPFEFKFEFEFKPHPINKIMHQHECTNILALK